MTRTFFAALFLIAVAVSDAFADPVVHYSPAGNAYAVTGLNVNGQIVSVTFQFGSYAEVFDSSPPWPFGIANLVAATEALAEALNGPPQALTAGPIGGPYEHVFIFLVLPPTVDGHLDGTMLGDSSYEGAWEFSGFFGWDTSLPDTAVWAVFAVPEPGTIALLIVGFIAIGSALRRQTR